MSHPEKSLQTERNCPFIEKEEHTLLEQRQEKKEADKYDIKFKSKLPKRKKPVEKEKDDIKEKIILTVGEHKFYSCPVATMIDNRGLTELIDLINWCSDMNTSLFDGGLVNHTYYYFQCYRTVIGEQRAIESEEMKRQRKEADANRRKGGKGRLGRPITGRASRARRK